NRAVAEIKKILNDFDGKWAEHGSVLWAFTPTAEICGTNAEPRGRWQAKFPQELNEEDKTRLSALVAALEEHDDVQEVYSNSS
ncbi:MAG: hypothetical protein Q8P07_03485, partial [bacterium]|nr:hypothetical protein [bacterium]